MFHSLSAWLPAVGQDLVDARARRARPSDVSAVVGTRWHERTSAHGLNRCMDDGTCLACARHDAAPLDGRSGPSLGVDDGRLPRDQKRGAGAGSSGRGPRFRSRRWQRDDSGRRRCDDFAPPHRRSTVSWIPCGALYSASEPSTPSPLTDRAVSSWRAKLSVHLPSDRPSSRSRAPRPPRSSLSSILPGSSCGTASGTGLPEASAPSASTGPGTSTSPAPSTSPSDSRCPT